MRYEAALTEALHESLCNDLLSFVRQGERQEELRFALWRPATGASRKTALVFEVIEPEDGERELHGNASFDPSYLTRSLALACQKKVGLAFMHNHLTPGWQGMSKPDEVAERDRISPPTRATDLPLLGMTLGTDGSWSARFWEWNGKKFERHWCDKVRVVGKQIRLTYNDQLLPPPKRQDILKRTIDTWGPECQNDLARLHVGVVGVGSVGGMVAEALARMGIENLLIVDHDQVETHNLDRLLHATGKDVGKHKALLTAKRLQDCATAADFNLDACILRAEDSESYGKLLDCDLIFSAVDRPLPKDLLNRIAYTHCIPVISGGVFVANKSDGSLGQAAWGVTAVGPERRCLRCDGQYTSSDVIMEKDGSLDDPSYIQRVNDGQQAQDSSLDDPTCTKGVNAGQQNCSLDDSSYTKGMKRVQLEMKGEDQELKERQGLQTNQNVFPFSANLASLMVIEMVRMVVADDWWPDAGGKLFYSLIPNQLESKQLTCEEYCSIHEDLAKGDAYTYPFILPIKPEKSERNWSLTGKMLSRLRLWFRKTQVTGS